MSESTSFFKEAMRGNNRLVMGLSAIAALGGFLFGYDTGIISGALLYIKQDLHAGQFEQQAIVSVILIGAIFGALGSGYLADRISRRWTKVMSGAVYVVAALFAAFSQTAVQLIAARFLLGLSVGTASFVSPMYISELAPPRIRGGTVSFNQVMITSGIFVSYLAAWALKGVTYNWRWMLGLGALPGLALAIGMLFVPHTPRWLIEQGREDDARDVLNRTLTDGDVDDEVAAIKKAASREGRVRDMVGDRIRPLLIIGLGLAIFQQFVGVNTVIYYGPTILSFTGLNANSAITQSVFIGLTNVVFTIVAVLLLDRVGRRKLLLTGTALLTVALGMLAAFFAFPAIQSTLPWFALAGLLLYIAGFAVGLGPVFWLEISEIFPLKLRSPAMSVSTMANWAANFLVSATFLTLTSAISRAGTFLLYGVISIGALAFFARRVPETKDRTLEQIEQDVTAPAGA